MDYFDEDIVSYKFKNEDEKDKKIADDIYGSAVKVYKDYLAKEISKDSEGNVKYSDDIANADHVDDK